MAFRTNWRRAEDWNDEGLHLNASNEVCQLYDAALTQYVGWYDDPNLGGLENTLDRMIKADPNFVLGKSLALGLELLGTKKTIRLDKDFKQQLDSLENYVKANNKLHIRERKHVDAIVQWANGRLYEATKIWEEILVEYPTDMQALKFGQDTYFYLGKFTQLRDSALRVAPVWKAKNPPLNNYIHGILAFGFEETNYFDWGEREAKIGLEKFANDGWATHSLAHVLEMQGRTKEGIKLMSSTTKNWETCNHLACHNYWHWALFHIEQEEYDVAIDLFENQIVKRSLQTKTMLDTVDTCSLLYRLDLVKPNEYAKLSNWEDAYSLVKDRLNDHILGFNDAHFLMACLGSKRQNEAEELMKTLNESVTNDEWVAVTKKLLEAMIEFNRENYVKAANQLNHIKYDIINIGGSNAQRDVFNQLLIYASLKSPLQCHKNLTKGLLNERKSFKSTPLLERLFTSIE